MQESLFKQIVQNLALNLVSLDENGNWSGMDIEIDVLIKTDAGNNWDALELFAVVYSANLEVVFVNYGDGIREENQRTEINRFVEVTECSIWKGEQMLELTQDQYQELRKEIEKQIDYL